MTYYDRLNRFFKTMNNNPLPAGAQLTYLHLLNINNRIGNTGQFRCTIADLMRLTRLSKNTIIEARRILKSERLIDYPPKQGNRACLYTILDNEAEPKQQPQPQQKSAALTENSAEVQKAWDKWGGVRLSGGIALELIQLENQYGTEKLLKAIEIAGKSNNRHNLSLNFVKAILEERGKNATTGTIHRRAEHAEGWENKRPDWLDD